LEYNTQGKTDRQTARETDRQTDRDRQTDIGVMKRFVAPMRQKIYLVFFQRKKVSEAISKVFLRRQFKSFVLPGMQLCREHYLKKLIIGSDKIS
jgi:hypothetical protein